MNSGLFAVLKLASRITSLCLHNRHVKIIFSYISPTRWAKAKTLSTQYTIANQSPRLSSATVYYPILAISFFLIYILYSNKYFKHPTYLRLLLHWPTILSHQARSKAAPVKWRRPYSGPNYDFVLSLILGLLNGAVGPEANLQSALHHMPIRQRKERKAQLFYMFPYQRTTRLPIIR
jgi:hypothetical protein